MAVGRDMVWVRYTDDRGATHSVKINKANADLVGSGFVAFNQTDPYLPAKYMRYVRGFDPASGDEQKVYAGTKAAALFAADLQFAYPRLGEELPVTFQIIGTVGESLPRPRGIINE